MMDDRPRVVAAEQPSGLIHGSVIPYGLRPGDNVPASLQYADGQRQDGLLWAISPIGAEIRLNDSPMNAPTDESVSLSFDLNGAPVQTRATIVSQTRQAGAYIIAMRFCTGEKVGKDEEKRASPRLLASVVYPPTGVLENRAAFNDLVFFRLRDASSTGFSFYTSLRNKFFVPQSVWSCRLSFPTFPPMTLTCKVRYARETDSDANQELIVGADVVRGSAKYKQRCGQYLLIFGTNEDGYAPTTAYLRTHGFSLSRPASAFSFSYVRTHEDYQDVVALRARAYKETLQDPSLAQFITWGDAFDARARILLARHRGQVVASCRLIFPNAGDQLEHATYCKLPAHLPPIDQLMESSRVCTDPAYRAADLLQAMFQYLALTSGQSGRRYILGNCRAELLKIYAQVGSKPLGAKFVHANDGSTHHLILSDVPNTLCGRTTSLFAWAAIVAPVIPLLRRSGSLRHLTRAQRLRLFINTLLKAPALALLALARLWKKATRGSK